MSRARYARVRLALAAPAGVVARYLLRTAPRLGGLALVAYGAWMAYHPAGYIVAGAGLLADQIADARKEPPR